jgi:inorganic pyrophosphatase
MVESVPTWSPEGDVMVVIETPRGTSNKLRFEPSLGLFSLSKVLPVGMSFPYDFGFIPGTQGEDGDPVDILVLMDAPLWPGCVVAAQVLGVIEAEQQQGGQWIRNDRLVATARKTPTDGAVRRLRDLDATLVEQIESFFVAYNMAEHRGFRCIGRRGPKRARQVIEQARR